MKRFVLFSFGLLIAAVSFGVDLSQATNQQLVHELSRRLNTTTPGGGGAIATYLCDGWGVLTAEIISPTGQVGRVQLDLGDTAPHCAPQARVLSDHKGRIPAFTQIAFCDHWGTISRYTVNEIATVTKVSESRLPNFNECLAAATTINSQH